MPPGLPDWLPQFLRSDLASWLAVVAASLAAVIAWLALRRPLTQVTFPDQWLARRDTGHLTVTGPVLFTPLGSSFVISERIATLKIERYKESAHIRSEPPLNQVHQGGHEYTIMLTSDSAPALRARSVNVEVRYKLLDGSRGRLNRTIPIEG